MAGGFSKRRSKSTGGGSRVTTTYNTKTGLTFSNSYKSGGNSRITQSSGPKGYKTVRTTTTSAGTQREVISSSPRLSEQARRRKNKPMTTWDRLIVTGLMLLLGVGMIIGSFGDAFP